MKFQDIVEYNLSARQKRNALDNKATIIITLPPKMFLDLTINSDEMKFLKDRVKTKETYQKWIDEEQITVHPYLDIDEETGKIMGHEGRARAYAAMLAGDTEYEIAVHLRPLGRHYRFKDVPEKWIAQYNKGFSINFKQLVDNGTIKVLDENVQKQYQRVDESFNKITVYHGTNHKSDKLLPKPSDYGKAVYVTNSEGLAKSYAEEKNGSIIYKLEMSVDQSQVLDLNSQVTIKEFEKIFGSSPKIKKYGESVVDRELSWDMVINTDNMFHSPLKEAEKHLLDAGIKVLKYKHGLQIAYAVLDPSVLKVISVEDFSNPINEYMEVFKAWYNTETRKFLKVPDNSHHTLFITDNPELFNFEKVVGMTVDEYQKKHKKDLIFDNKLIELFTDANWVRLSYTTGKPREEMAIESKNNQNAAKAARYFLNYIIANFPSDDFQNNPICYIAEPNMSYEEVFGENFYKFIKTGKIHKDYVSENIMDNVDVVKAWYDINTKKLYILPKKYHHTTFILKNPDLFGFEEATGYSVDEYHLMNDDEDAKMFDEDLIKLFLKKGWVRLVYDYSNKQPEIHSHAYTQEQAARALRAFFKYLTDKYPDSYIIAHPRAFLDTKIGYEIVTDDSFYNFIKTGKVQKNYVYEANYANDEGTVKQAEEALAKLKAFMKKDFRSLMQYSYSTPDGGFAILGKDFGYPDLAVYFDKNQYTERMIASFKNHAPDILKKEGVKYTINMDVLPSTLAELTDQQKDSLVNILNHEISLMFVHEFVHYLDEKRHKGNGLLISKKGNDIKVKSEKDYFNSAHEFNAYFIQGLTNFLHHTKDVDKSKVPDLNTFIKDIMDSSVWTKDFINNMNEVYKKKFMKRLALVWQDLTKADFKNFDEESYKKRLDNLFKSDK